MSKSRMTSSTIPSSFINPTSTYGHSLNTNHTSTATTATTTATTSSSSSYPFRQTMLNSNSANTTNTNTNTNANMNTDKIEEEKSTPYISVDGRRKRRRTTLDDAFRHLNIMEQQQQQQQQQGIPFVTPNSNINTILNNHTLNISKKLNFIPTSMPTTTSMLPSSSTTTTTTGLQLSSSRKHTRANDMPYDNYDVDDDDDDDDDEMDGMILHSNLDYNHETSFCSLTSSTDDNDNDNDNVQDVHLELDEEEEEEEEEEISSHLNNNNNDDRRRQRLRLPPIHPVLFAPRKDKNKQKTTIYNHHINPVDDRIEELIRHSRLQAMIQSNCQNQNQNQNSSSSQGLNKQEHTIQLRRRRNYEKMLFGQNEKVKSMDDGDGRCHTLRRKNSGADVDVDVHAGIDTDVDVDTDIDVDTDTCTDVLENRNDIYRADNGHDSGSRGCRFKRQHLASTVSFSSTTTNTPAKVDSSSLLLPSSSNMSMNLDGNGRRSTSSNDSTSTSTSSNTKNKIQQPTLTTPIAMTRTKVPVHKGRSHDDGIIGQRGRIMSRNSHGNSNVVSGGVCSKSSSNTNSYGNVNHIRSRSLPREMKYSESSSIRMIKDIEMS